MVAEVTKISSLIAVEWDEPLELGKDAKNESRTVRLRK